MRLVINPGDSLITTTSFPIRLPTSTAVASVSSSVSKARTTSISFILCTGLKKCIPTHFFARRFFHRVGILHSTERGIGVGSHHFPQLHCLVEIRPDFGLSPAQRRRQQVFENGAIAANRRRMRNAAPHNTGADHCDGSNLRHYGP